MAFASTTLTGGGAKKSFLQDKSPANKNVYMINLFIIVIAEVRK